MAVPTELGDLGRPVGCVDPREPVAGLGGFVMPHFCGPDRIRRA